MRRPPHRLLYWETASRVPIATILPEQSEYKLSIVYERDNAPPVTVSGLSLYFVRLANFGDVPIRPTDLTPADPLRLEVEHPQVLDISLAAVARDVANFQVQPFTQEGELATSILTFDFLDKNDGALIRVLASGPTASIRVRGTIVGMPEGIQPPGREGFPIWPFVAFVALLILLYAGAIFGTVAVFLASVEDASLLWLLFLPIASFFLPSIIAGVVWMLAFPPVGWPEPIRRPQWAILAGVTPGQIHFRAGLFQIRRVPDDPTKTEF